VQYLAIYAVFVMFELLE